MTQRGSCMEGSVSGSGLAGGPLRISEYVLLEPPLIGEYVVDEAAQEGDVASGADGDVVGRVGARPREAWIDVDDRCPQELGLDHPLEPDRVVLGHVRAHDQDAIR